MCFNNLKCWVAGWCLKRVIKKMKTIVKPYVFKTAAQRTSTRASNASMCQCKASAKHFKMTYSFIKCIYLSILIAFFENICFSLHFFWIAYCSTWLEPIQPRKHMAGGERVKLFRPFWLSDLASFRKQKVEDLRPGGSSSWPQVLDLVFSERRKVGNP